MKRYDGDIEMIECLKSNVVKICTTAGLEWDKIRGRKFVHFIHVGKTGGTSIKEALWNNLRTSKNYRIVLHGHSFTLKDVPEGSKAFFFIRDPVERFISGFYSRKRRGRPRYDIPWSKKEQIAFSRFGHPNELALSLSSDSENKRKKAYEAMMNIQHIRDPLSRWYISKNYFLSRIDDVLMVGKTERLSSDFNRFKKCVGISRSVRLPNSDVKSHASPDSLDRNLDQESMYNLRDWYREDYEFIGLCESNYEYINYCVE